MSSLFVLIPGFGEPNVATKLDILYTNIQTMKQYPWAHLLIRICVYDDTLLPSWLIQDANVEIVRQPGIVADFIRECAIPQTLYDNKFDYVMLLLDDVLLTKSFPWQDVLRWKKELNIDIISPSLSHDSKHVYKYMLQNRSMYSTLRITRVCEMFCYFMDIASFTRYYQHMDASNPWLWGLDLILDMKLGLSTAIMDTVVMKHFFHGEGYLQRPDKLPTDGYNYTLAKYGVTDAEVRDQQHTKYVVFESPSLMQS